MNAKQKNLAGTWNNGELVIAGEGFPYTWWWRYQGSNPQSGTIVQGSGNAIIFQFVNTNTVVNSECHLTADDLIECTFFGTGWTQRYKFLRDSKSVA